MSTFNKAPRSGRATPTVTHEGGPALQPSPLVDLMFTTACTFIGQDTFYESADARHQRITKLVQEAAAVDPDGVVDLIQRIRRDFKIRAAAIVVATEYVKARPDHRVREAVANACWRADEPAEFLAYWLGRFGQPIPRGVKMGLGDAVHKLYTQRNALKWDSKDRAVRMGDVLELCHVKPEWPGQATLYRYLLDVRHRGNDAWDIETMADDERRAVKPGQFPFDPAHLDMFMRRNSLMAVPEDRRRALLREAGTDFLATGGVTWEQLSSWLPGGMDAEAWQFAIPSMQVMALLRNLRNFDKVGISTAWVDQVIAKITNEEDVRASRIFPYQVLTAYQYAESDNWQRALGQTVELASGNLPRMPRSLFLIDTSGSMGAGLSQQSTVARVNLAALMAASVAKHSKDSDVVIFGHGSERVAIPAGESILRTTQRIVSMVGHVGHATFGHTAIQRHFDADRHDRVVLFTDDQQQDSYLDISHVPQVLTFNIGGYAPKATWGRQGGQVNMQVTGYSDEIFRVAAELLTNA